jgi:chitinase
MTVRRSGQAARVPQRHAAFRGDRSRLLRLLVAGFALLLTVAGCSSAVPGDAASAPSGGIASGAPTPTPSAASARPAFGPYVDTSVAIPDLAALATQTGLKHVVLSFVVAQGKGCDPVWNGSDPLDSLKAPIDAFHAAGGSVTIATGGADGTYIENACANAADLAAAYTKILDATGTNLLDIDVEHDVQINKVIDALSRVHQARGTDITLTLPVDLAGLGPGQLGLVKRAAAVNLPITINIMDMDFHADGDWGKAMVAAAQTMLGQLRKVYPKATPAEQNRRLGITIMIGRNDNGVITAPRDAQTVLDYARSHGVGRLGIWSLARDRGTCAKRVEAQPDCSGTAQKDFQYTQQLAAFTGPAPA